MIISKGRFERMQETIRTLADSLRLLAGERDELSERVPELEREVRRLRDAAASLQVQRDKFMRLNAKLEEDNRFLNAVLDTVSAGHNSELIRAVTDAGRQPGV